ncbi:Actin patch 1 protein [Rutstroemia sp. NJR-2017a WRK4]|nr:Actin patch 1 protein [Rutstroemia sp. NJR-2017a WRK4]
MISSLPTVLLALIPIALAAPAPHPVAAPVAHPMITPRASLTDRTPSRVQERDIISSIEGLGSYLTSVLGTYPSYIASGVPNFFQDFPTGTAVMSSLGINDDDLAATPTQVLNIPGYANWTNQGWNLRVHGNVFKQPNISESKLNDLANVFLVGTSVEDLPAAQASQARNLTAEIFVVQQGNVNVSFHLEPAPSQGGDGESGGSSAVTPPGGAQNISIVGQTTIEGDYDQFIQIANVSGPGGYLAPGNETSALQRLNVYTDGTLTGNATSYLVPESGLTIISDIDDILRVTKIYEPKEGLLNSFARAFTPWMNMPDIYANWSRSIPNFHFHYLTTTPEQVTRNYMEFIYETYPGGSFDTRPLNFSDVSATLSIRKFLLTKIFETFPNRKFILVADTSNSDVMKDYPEMATDFPGQVQCIFLRNTSSTDSGDKFPYDTSGFKGLNQSQYMFFNVPDDLTNLDIVNGQCYNSTIVQNVTFSEQGLPFGLSKKSAGGRVTSWNAVSVAWVALIGAVVAML